MPKIIRNQLLPNRKFSIRSEISGIWTEIFKTFGLATWTDFFFGLLIQVRFEHFDSSSTRELKLFLIF